MVSPTAKLKNGHSIILKLSDLCKYITLVAAILNMRWEGERKPGGVQKTREKGIRKIWFAQNLQPGYCRIGSLLGAPANRKQRQAILAVMQIPLSSS